MYLIKEKSDEWIPYFGNQNRFINFVIETLHGIGVTGKMVFAETNSGSHAISYAVRKTFNCQTLSNDISSYSKVIGMVLNGMGETRLSNNKTEAKTSELFGKTSFTAKVDDLVTSLKFSAIDAAALGAMLIDVGGYDLQIDWSSSFPVDSYNYWKAYLEKLPAKSGGIILQEDLFSFLSNNTGDVVYMDFAWPWKDGRDVVEYSGMVDMISSIIEQRNQTYISWTKFTVMKNVLQACSLAVKNFKYTILSNQSSNFPPSEVLESYLFGNPDFKVIATRSLTLPAEEVDNRKLDSLFTEYQYLLEKR